MLTSNAVTGTLVFGALGASILGLAIAFWVLFGLALVAEIAVFWIAGAESK